MPPAPERVLSAWGLEAGLGDGEIDEVLRDALLGEDLLHHGAVLAGAAQGGGHVGAEAGGVGEDADVAGDLIVDDEGQVGGDVELGLEPGDELWVGGEGDVVFEVGEIERGCFDLGGEAVALLEGGHLERVDGVDEALELVGEGGIAGERVAAREQEVDGRVEVEAGGIEVVAVVVVDAGAVAVLGLADELLHSGVLLGVGRLLQIAGGLLDRSDVAGLVLLLRGTGGRGGQGGGAARGRGIGIGGAAREKSQRGGEQEGGESAAEWGQGHSIARGA